MLCQGAEQLKRTVLQQKYHITLKITLLYSPSLLYVSKYTFALCFK